MIVSLYLKALIQYIRGEGGDLFEKPKPPEVASDANANTNPSSSNNNNNKAIASHKTPLAIG